MSGKIAPLRLATVDLAAIEHNIREIAAVVGDVQIMAVVKANGYGHGAIEVSRVALKAGATWLGVADVDEALVLRDAGIEAPILAWLHDPSARFEQAISRNIDVGVSSLAQLDALGRAATELGTARVQLKIDTGLGRNGAEETLWTALFDRAAELEQQGLVRVVGIFSHLANAGPEEDRAQLERLKVAVARAAEATLQPAIVHLASTAGALRFPEARLSLVRIGIGIYGLSPFEGVSSAELGLRPALSCESRVISVKQVSKNTGVSYGYAYRTQAETTLALVSLGYADGVPRLVSNRAPVWINGGRYRISGRVAMDQFVVDLGDAEVAVGDRVVLFGDPAEGYPSIDDWAQSAETINYEIVTRLGRRIERRYLE